MQACVRTTYRVGAVGKIILVDGNLAGSNAPAQPSPESPSPCNHTMVDCGGPLMGVMVTPLPP